jgi:hypothetical protein
MNRTGKKRKRNKKEKNREMYREMKQARQK